MKCLENFRKKFELKKALPDWPYRGHPLFPEGIYSLVQSRNENAIFSTHIFFICVTKYVFYACYFYSNNSNFISLLASKCVRASPKEGSTSGFFLALFEARNSKETLETARQCKGNKTEHHINRWESETFTGETRQKLGRCVVNATSPEVDLKRRKRTCCTANNFENSQTHKKRIKLSSQTHRRCSNEEFENRLKLLKKKTKGRKWTEGHQNFVC